MIITIPNWEKYNPDSRSKSSSWFRFENKIFFDPEFSGLVGYDFTVWMFLLSYISFKNKRTGKITCSHELISTAARVPIDAVRTALTKLEQLQCVTISDMEFHTEFHVATRTHTEPHVITCLRTNERTNVRVLPECSVEHAFVEKVKKPPNPIFEELYEMYPKRLGGTGKQVGLDRLSRLPAKDLPLFTKAVKNYKAHCIDAGSEKTPYVMQFGRFCGKEWREWVEIETQSKAMEFHMWLDPVPTTGVSNG